MGVFRYLKTSRNERMLFWEAYRLSLLSRLTIWFMPVKRYSTWLGKQNTETPANEIDCIYAKAYSIAHAVRRSSRYAVWPAKCLVEAMTAKKMLDKRHIPSTIYLGVGKNQKKQLIAHAWLRCGSIIIVGRKGMEQFKPVAWFS